MGSVLVLTCMIDRMESFKFINVNELNTISYSNCDTDFLRWLSRISFHFFAVRIFAFRHLRFPSLRTEADVSLLPVNVKIPCRRGK